MTTVPGTIELHRTSEGRRVYALLVWPTPLADMPAGQWMLMTPAVDGPGWAIALALDAAERLGVDAVVLIDTGPPGQDARKERARQGAARP